MPTAANAEYYAEVVHERAVPRRLAVAGTRITQMGYAANDDEIVNRAQAKIYAVTEQHTSEDYLRCPSPCPPSRRPRLKP